MISIELLNRRLQFSWIALGLYLLLTALLCSLGFWQLGRAEQKKQLLKQQQIALIATPINLNQANIIDIETVRYQSATITGRYDAAHQFLLDNQIVEGKNGYFVMTPFLVDGQNRAVLVNRGWVALGKDRTHLPNIDLLSPQTQVSGRINQFPTVGIKLKGAEIPTNTWPSVVQLIDSQVLTEKLGYEIASFQLELEPESQEGYKREWKINTAIPPEKHLGYAVQWFGLALTLTALFFWISLKKRSEYSA